MTDFFETLSAEAVDLPAAVWGATGNLPFTPALPGSPAPGRGTTKTIPVRRS